MEQHAENDPRALLASARQDIELYMQCASLLRAPESRARASLADRARRAHPLFCRLADFAELERARGALSAARALLAAALLDSQRAPK